MGTGGAEDWSLCPAGHRRLIAPPRLRSWCLRMRPPLCHQLMGSHAWPALWRQRLWLWLWLPREVLLLLPGLAQRKLLVLLLILLLLCPPGLDPLMRQLWLLHGWRWSCPRMLARAHCCRCVLRCGCCSHQP